MASSGPKIKCDAEIHSCVSSNPAAQSSKCVDRQEMTMHWDAKRHQGVERNQSIATLGVATESKRESFIYLDMSWAEVDQRIYSDVNRNSIAALPAVVRARGRPPVQNNLLELQSLRSSNDASPPICNDPSKTAYGQQPRQPKKAGCKWDISLRSLVSTFPENNEFGSYVTGDSCRISIPKCDLRERSSFHRKTEAAWRTIWANSSGNPSGVL